MAEHKDIYISENGKVLSRICSGSGLEEALPLLEGEASVFLVYDRNVKSHADRLMSMFGFRSSMAIEATEENKDMSTVTGICSWLMKNGADRFSLLLAMGGGITTDMAGFAASVFKRGVRFACIPTTLLAQVDAAIGGKTGVNFMGLKNMLGVIRQPVFTFECPEVLATLSRRDFIGGSAEMLKSFIIEDKDGNYRKAVETLGGICSAENTETAMADHSESLLSLIREAAGVKAGIVGRDQFEHGERRKLNLGHTFAHAIEKKSGYAISHGEAVAIGIVMAARLSDRLGLTDGNAEKTLRADFSACGLPVDCPFDNASLIEAMQRDKKSENGSIHFVLMRGIGEVITKNMKANDAL